MSKNARRAPRSLAAARRDRVVREAEEQGGVMSRRRLYALGMTRGEVRAQVRAGRWQRIGTQSLAVRTGPLTTTARQWAAVFEAGPRAHLDGVSALIASGLENYTQDRTRVSVPKGARIQRRRRATVDIRETRRFDPGDVMPTGVPRSRPAIAAVRGALWAVTDRQASLVVTMAVQQGLCTVEQLGEALMRIKRDKRRTLLYDLVIDLAGGVRSLNELDFLRGCRTRGLPEPDLQVLRQAGGDRYFMDCRWERWGVVVEVDGIHHSWAQELVRDALRHNTIALAGDVVLRLPVLGLRVCPDEFFAQVAEALRAAGCPLPEDLIA
jgi:very-short-patch-repair endonuclease